MTRWELKRRTIERSVSRVKDFAESIGLPRDSITCWHNCAISEPGVGWGAQVSPALARKALAMFDRAINGKRIARSTASR